MLEFVAALRDMALAPSVLEWCQNGVRRVALKIAMLGSNSKGGILAFVDVDGVVIVIVCCVVEGEGDGFYDDRMKRYGNK